MQPLFIAVQAVLAFKIVSLLVLGIMYSRHVQHAETWMSAFKVSSVLKAILFHQDVERVTTLFLG